MAVKNLGVLFDEELTINNLITTRVSTRTQKCMCSGYQVVHKYVHVVPIRLYTNKYIK